MSNPKSFVELTLDVAGRTVAGLVRTNNEDQFLIARLLRGVHCIDSSLPADALAHFNARSGYLLVVSDGMGGRAAGEVASATAVEVVVQCVEEVFDGQLDKKRPPDEKTSELLQESVERAASILKTIQRRSPEKLGMGCTLTLGYIVDGALWIAHVGDSRAYMVRQRKIHRLTKDHTWAEALRDADAITNVDDHPGRHMLTNVLGGKDELFVDVKKIPLKAGDVLMFCSDGVHGCITDEKLGKAVVQSATAEAATKHLIDMALAEGAPDNATVVVARVGSSMVKSEGDQTLRIAQPSE